MEIEPVAALLKFDTKANEVDEPVVVVVARSVKNPLHPSSDWSAITEAIAKTLVNLRGSITSRILHDSRRRRVGRRRALREHGYTELMGRGDRQPNLGLRFNSFVAWAMVAASLACAAQTKNALPAKTQLAEVSERDVRAEMNFLASDAMQGRGSGTQFELIAGTYIASMLQEFGVEPAGDPAADGKPGYIQTVNLVQPSFAAPPVLSAGSMQFTHGKQIAVNVAAQGEWSGPLQKLKSGDAVQPGAVLLISAGEDPSAFRSQIGALLEKRPAAVLVADSPVLHTAYERIAARPVRLPQREKGGGPMTMGAPANVILLGTEATSQISALPDGAQISFKGEVKDDAYTTWNVVGKLTGMDEKSSGQAVLVGAHMDHLGVDPKLQGDQIYNGADDDASGTIAVMELARVLGAGPRPKRTVYFVLFGSEEKGGVGSTY